MISITDEIRETILDYLECDKPDDGDYSDEFYAFYYQCYEADMHYADADRYAILNTLLDYDIGMDNARAIDEWMYENEEEIYELTEAREEDRFLIMKASEELGLNLDFSKWIGEAVQEYKYFV